jgi:hypothetical protein
MGSAMFIMILLGFCMAGRERAHEKTHVKDYDQQK